MIGLINLQQLLDTAANLDAQLRELVELRKRVEKALLSARHHNLKRRTRRRRRVGRSAPRINTPT
jgi:hypothetical protein